ncbi:MAG: PQQ-binding-like beta-propeller repeat protein [Bacteroidota bacterium]
MRTPLSLAVGLLIGFASSSCAPHASCEHMNGLQSDAAMQTCALALEMEPGRSDALGPADGAPMDVMAPPLTAAAPPARFPNGSMLLPRPWGLLTVDADGEVLRQDSLGHVWSTAATSDGSHYAVGLEDGRIRMHSDNGDSVIARVNEGTYSIAGMDWPNWAHRLAFSPDGSILYATDALGSLTASDAAKGERLWESEVDGHSRLAVSPDGAFVATGSRDKTASVWDATTGALVGTWTHRRSVANLAFTPDSQALLVRLTEKEMPAVQPTSTERLLSNRRTYQTQDQTLPSIVVVWSLP